MPLPPDIQADLAQIAQTARHYLKEAGLDRETRPEMLARGGMRAKARRLVKEQFYKEVDLNVDEDIYVVWFAKTLQNWKCLISTNVADDAYYEVTYNGDKKETYVDQYIKRANICVPD